MDNEMPPTRQPDPELHLTGKAYHLEWTRLNSSRVRIHVRKYQKNHPEQVKQTKLRCYQKKVQTIQGRQKHRMESRENNAGWKNAINRYQNWTSEEDSRVLEHSLPDKILSQEIGRSFMAICQRRSKLKEQTNV